MEHLPAIIALLIACLIAFEMYILADGKKD
jgi:hypothetical protein